MQDSPPNDQRRMYTDLAGLWPIISPPEDYVAESEFIARMVREHADVAVQSLLHLGCGGGHNDHTLKLHFSVTGVDSSLDMLSLARRLNPEVMYEEGDMRSVRLNRVFDAVCILDSINYMLTEDDLKAAFDTAFVHLRPGGVLLTCVEDARQGFKQNTTRCSVHKTGDTEVTLIENAYDPDSSDTTYESTFIYLVRERGDLKIETDRHLCGLFTMNVWYDNLRMAGFEVRQLSLDEGADERGPIPLLLCTRRA